QWHWFRQALRHCERVLADLPTVERLKHEGITHARQANLFGLGRDFFEQPGSGLPRDIDILFIGNLAEPIQRDRLSWLGRLARLRSRWNVQIGTGIEGADYYRHLRRARVVFNLSIRGEANKRAFEACCGALLFQEDTNQETPLYLTDRQHCVYYNESNLEELLDYYLSHESQRRALAEAACARAADFSFAALWRQTLAQLEAEWPALKERVKSRPAWDERQGLLARTWQE